MTGEITALVKDVDHIWDTVLTAAREGLGRTTHPSQRLVCGTL